MILISLGIDQSFTSTGYFITDDDMFKYGIITSNKVLHPVVRAGDVTDEIISLVEKYEPDVITLEGLPFMSKSNVTRDLAGLQYIILDRLLLYSYTIGLDLLIVPPSQLKKFATGSGKASKQEMFESLPDGMQKKIGTVGKTKGRYDITDAYWLCKYGEQNADIDI